MDELNIFPRDAGLVVIGLGLGFIAHMLGATIKAFARVDKGGDVG
jgi:hypothetical protein